MCATAGILMLTRFNWVRAGHSEALLLVTVLACFLGGVDPRDVSLAHVPREADGDRAGAAAHVEQARPG